MTQNVPTMVNKNYLFYLWVLRKLPLTLRSSPNFYFLTNTLAAVIFLLPIAALLWWLDNPFAAETCVAASVILMLNLLAWRFGLRMLWTHAVYQITLTGLILLNAAVTGGLTSAYLIFMGLVPLLAVFCMNRHWAIFWVVISFFVLLWLFIAQMQGWLPGDTPLKWQQLAQNFLCIIVLEITQVILVFVYDSAHAQSMHALNRTNRRLASTTQALKLADSHKDKFLAMVSHDMRTPLNAVIGYLGLLHDHREWNNESAGFVASAQHAATHLLTVINDLLDFSQIRLGQLILHPQVVNLPHVLQQTFDTLTHQAQEMQLDYKLSLDPQLPQWVRIDQNRLSQILINLLGNAIKFTPQGWVHMRASLTGQQGSPLLLVEVEDTGIGMTEEQQKHIFHPFIQVHDAQTALRMSEPMRGNGLGLAISQSLVKSHHGELGLTSRPGVGTTFTITLPLEIAAEPTLPTDQPPQADDSMDQTAMQLLVVDDNQVNRLLVTTTLLRHFPHAEIDQAENGQQALEKMRTHVYDLVLIDLVMPDIDGAQVAQQIRQEADKPMRDVPMVALTANVAQDALERCRLAGINHVLAKPFDRHMLIRVVRFLALNRQQGEL